MDFKFGKRPFPRPPLSHIKYSNRLLMIKMGSMFQFLMAEGEQ